MNKLEFLKVNSTFEVPNEFIMLKVIITGKNFMHDKLLQVIGVKFKNDVVEETLNIVFNNGDVIEDLIEISKFINNNILVSQNPVFVSKFILWRMYNKDVIKPDYRVFNVTDLADYYYEELPLGMDYEISNNIVCDTDENINDDLYFLNSIYLNYMQRVFTEIDCELSTLDF